MCSTTRIVRSFGLSSDHLLLAHHKSRVSLVANSNLSYLKTSTSKYGRNFLSNSGLLPLKIRAEHQHTKSDKDKMDVTANSHTGTPGPSHGGWKSWILGTLLTIILPFWKLPWGPLSKIKRDVQTFVGVIDAGTEVLEKVADGIVKVADEVAEHLPEGSQLRETVCNVYHVAQNVADGAHKADEIIHKIEKLGEESEERLEKIKEEGEEKSVDAKKEREDEEVVKDIEKVKSQENVVEEESKIVIEPGVVVNQEITMSTATTKKVIEQNEQKQTDK